MLHIEQPRIVKLWVTVFIESSLQSALVPSNSLLDGTVAPRNVKLRVTVCTEILLH